MIRNKTRIRITWFTLLVSALVIVGGFYVKWDNVVISALGTISVVAMAYIGGKTWNNQKHIENEKSNS